MTRKHGPQPSDRTRSTLARRLSAPTSQLTPLERREALWGFLFISPWLVGFLLFTLLPTLATLGLSFTNFNLSSTAPFRFVGLKNYQDMLADPQVWASLRVTFTFAALWLPVTMIVPFMVAVMLNSPRLRGSSFFRILIFLPYVVPFVAGVADLAEHAARRHRLAERGPARTRLVRTRPTG